MSQSTSNGLVPSNAPDAATDAVFKPSAPVGADAQAVKGLEFNNYRDNALTVEDLVANMAGMGFQASAVAEAVQIVNAMVSFDFHPQKSHTFTELIKWPHIREHGRILKPMPEQPYF